MQQTSEMIVVREVRFGLDEADSDIPSHWHRAGLAVSRYFDTLSLFFPAGERFFIAAVRAFEPAIRNPELKAQVRLFCAQEGGHAREHVAYNRMLDHFGYAGSRLDHSAVTYLRRLSRILSPRIRLAVTCAIEHFTAILAHLLMSAPEIMQDAHPRLAAVWRWHAVEENEHKAVAFDVYREVGGDYLTRVIAMFLTTIIFAYKIVRFYFLLVPGESGLSKARQFIAAQKYFIRHISQRELFRLYRDYYRPDFHPWDQDNRALLDAWRDQLTRSQHVAFESATSLATELA